MEPDREIVIQEVTMPENPKTTSISKTLDFLPSKEDIGESLIKAIGVTAVMIASPLLLPGLVVYQMGKSAQESHAEMQKKVNEMGYKGTSPIKDFCKDGACKVCAQIKNFFTQRIGEAIIPMGAATLSTEREKAVSRKENINEKALDGTKYDPRLVSKSDSDFLNSIMTKKIDTLGSNDLNRLAAIETKVNKRQDVLTQLGNLGIIAANGEVNLSIISKGEVDLSRLPYIHLNKFSKDEIKDLKNFINKITNHDKTPPKPLSEGEADKALEILGKIVQSFSKVDFSTQIKKLKMQLQSDTILIASLEQNNDLDKYPKLISKSELATLTKYEGRDFKSLKGFDINFHHTLRHKIQLRIDADRALDVIGYPIPEKMPEKAKLKLQECHNILENNNPLSMDEANDVLKIAEQWKIQKTATQLLYEMRDAFPGDKSFRMTLDLWNKKINNDFINEDEMEMIKDLHTYCESSQKKDNIYTEMREHYTNLDIKEIIPEDVYHQNLTNLQKRFVDGEYLNYNERNELKNTYDAEKFIDFSDEEL